MPTVASRRRNSCCTKNRSRMCGVETYRGELRWLNRAFLSSRGYRKGAVTFAGKVVPGLYSRNGRRIPGVPSPSNRDSQLACPAI